MTTTPLQKPIEAVKHWYIPLIIGIVLILVGLYVFSRPLASYVALSLVFSMAFLITGILQISFSIANKDELDGWGWYLAGGIFYLLTGIVLLSRPEISIAALPFVVGFFSLFFSISALGWAFDLKNIGIKNWGGLAVFAILGIIFSFILLWNPDFAGLSLVIWTGIAFIAAGVAGIMLSLRLHKIKETTSRISDELKKRISSIMSEYRQALAR
ncbi:MAG: hypothetical protein C5B59_10875 [Bacteroidetes bacterium]|nr:MAG: hypothetical protein C5B59_10875 [Bacteroidota bacterium]